MDYTDLDNTLIGLLKRKSNNLKDKNQIKLSEASGFKKVAFDIFKDHYNDLWRLEESNGEQILVRSSDPKFEYTNGQEGWSAACDYDRKNITLCYKDIPIQRFSSDEYEFENDVGIFKSALLESISEDSNFVKNILYSQPKSKLDALCQTFPEIMNLIKK